jgi:5'-phosphate synthase pdxT subunit
VRTEPALRVGVLALQGDFREHVLMLRELGVAAEALRSPGELEAVDALVMPGGESTTMDKLLRKFGLHRPLRDRIAAGLPVLATCAGTIMLADDVVDGTSDQESLHLLPIRVRRNAYGRQPESFEADLEIAGLLEPFRGVFIRAPVIESISDDVVVLAEARGHPVAVRRGSILALAFHPELTADSRVHRLFLDVVAGS